MRKSAKVRLGSVPLFTSSATSSAGMPLAVAKVTMLQTSPMTAPSGTTLPWLGLALFIDVIPLRKDGLALGQIGADLGEVDEARAAHLHAGDGAALHPGDHCVSGNTVHGSEGFLAAGEGVTAVEVDDAFAVYIEADIERWFVQVLCTHRLSLPLKCS